MERINIEDARIRVEFRKNETNEVVKSEWFDVVSYFCTREDDEDFKEAFFYWLDNYHYKLLYSDILDLINRAKNAYMGYYENIDDFIEEMFDAQYPDCPPDIKYYIDYSSFQRDLMYDFWEIDGHIFKQ